MPPVPLSRKYISLCHEVLGLRMTLPGFRAKAVDTSESVTGTAWPASGAFLLKPVGGGGLPTPGTVVASASGVPTVGAGPVGGLPTPGTVVASAPGVGGGGLPTPGTVVASAPGEATVGAGPGAAGAAPGRVAPSAACDRSLGWSPGARCTAPTIGADPPLPRRHRRMRS